MCLKHWGWIIKVKLSNMLETCHNIWGQRDSSPLRIVNTFTCHVCEVNNLYDYYKSKPCPHMIWLDNLCKVILVIDTVFKWKQEYIKLHLSPRVMLVCYNTTSWQNGQALDNKFVQLPSLLNHPSSMMEHIIKVQSAHCSLCSYISQRKQKRECTLGWGGHTNKFQWF